MTPSELFFDCQIALTEGWWVAARYIQDREEYSVSLTKSGEPAIFGTARSLKAALAKALAEWADR